MIKFVSALLVLFITVVSAHCQIPVLCYHQVRDWKSTDSKSARPYIIPVATFRQHMKALHDSGYQVILPDELVACLTGKRRLPAKPVVLTFDDGSLSEYTNALPVLNEYGYKAVFFIMTVSINRPNFMSREQIRALANAGHIIGCHTWDHHMVTKYTPADWDVQVIKPTKLLEQITGRPVKYFAYPNGVWDHTAVMRLMSLNYMAAFQLMGKTDDTAPLFTQKRIIADGAWSGARLIKEMQKVSNQNKMLIPR